MPLQRASLNGSGAPFSQNDVGVIASGAVSRPSIVVTFPLGGADDHEAAAADAARERLGDAEHRRRGDRRVDGVSAAP